MKKGNRSGTLFLLEMIFTILFFSIAAAVCVTVFAKAHTISADAQKLSHAAAEVSNACEAISTAGSAEEAEARLGMLHSFSGGEALLDGNYRDTADPDAPYILGYDLQEEDGMLKAYIYMKDKGTEDEIFAQETVVHIRRQR